MNKTAKVPGPIWSLPSSGGRLTVGKSSHNVMSYSNRCYEERK